MDFHHRKLLILEKIIPSKKNETDDEKENDSCEFPCSPNCLDDCKNYADTYLPLPPPPPPPQPPSHHSSSILVLMLCILGVALFIVSYFSVVRYRSRNSRRRISQPVNETREDFIDEDRGPVVDHPIWYIRTVGLQQSVIDSIAVFKYKRDEGLIEGTDCSVCLSEFQEDENLRLLPKCNHAFHIHCIDTWLRSHKNCPLCRAPIVSEANPAQVNAGDTNLNGSASAEENEAASVQNRGEVEFHDDVEENRTSEIRTRRESVDSLPMEEKYQDKEIVEGNSYPQPARSKKARVKSDLADRSVKLDEAMKPMRRSISMDASSAAMVYLAAANNFSVEGGCSSRIKDEGCSNVHMVHKMKQNSEIIVLKPENRNSSIYRLVKSSSLGRSLQKVPRSMKRSFSSTGKSSLPTHSSRSQDSI